MGIDISIALRMHLTYTWPVGVVLAGCASLISNLGLTLQKLSHLREHHRDELKLRRHHQHSGSGSLLHMKPKNYWKTPLWIVGLSLVIVASIADIVALSFSPQSLIAPLGSLTLVSNTILAPLLLRETVSSSDIAATATIILGSTVAVVFGSHEDYVYSISDLFGFFLRPAFLVYAVLVTIFIVICSLLIAHMEHLERVIRTAIRTEHAEAAQQGIHRVPSVDFNALARHIHDRDERQRQRGSSPVSASATDDIEADDESGPLFIPDSALIHVETYARSIHHLRFAYPAISGCIGAQSVLFAKCFVELMMNTIRGTGSMFYHWESYIVTIALFGTIFLQIKWLNDGLARFDASYCVPVFTSFWILLSVTSGMVFYSEYKGMTTTQLWLFAFGVCVTILGVSFLGKRPFHSQSGATTPLTFPSDDDTEEHYQTSHIHTHAQGHSSQDEGTQTNEDTQTLLSKPKEQAY